MNYQPPSRYQSFCKTSSEIQSIIDQITNNDYARCDDSDREVTLCFRNLTSCLESRQPSKKEIRNLAARNGAVLTCCAKACSLGHWKVSAAALQSLQALAKHFSSTELIEGISVEITGLFQEVTRLLQLLQKPSSISHGKAVYRALGLAHSLLVLTPQSVLPTTFLTACRPYLFYGLPSYIHALQGSGGAVSVSAQELQDHLDSLHSSECDQNVHKSSFSNKNRRKRLRRKKVQPNIRTSGSELMEVRKNLVVTVWGGDEGPALPRLVHPPGPEALNLISLKPEWMCKSRTEQKSQSFVSTVAQLNNDSNQVLGTDETSPRDVCSALYDKFYDDTVARDLSTCHSSEFKTGVYKANPQNDVDLADDEENADDIVWSRSILTARVRQAAITSISALVSSVSASKCGKMTYWAPLFCQSPSVLIGLLSEPQSHGRAAWLALLTQLLTDSRQSLSVASDSNDRHTAYNSLCHELACSIRELHSAMVRVLLVERGRDSIVRALKVLELLIENVSYSKLAPGLLSNIVRAVKPLINREGAVVRANALSVLVCVLNVRPVPSEVSSLLLRYTPLGHCHASAVIEQNLPECTSSDDNASLFSADDEEEVLPEEDLKEKETSLNSCDFGESVEKLPQHAGRTLIGWLVGYCVDVLVPTTPVAECASSQVVTRSSNTRCLSEGNADSIEEDMEKLSCNAELGVLSSRGGVCVQVQLQSLKLLMALVSEHFCLLYLRLPVLQHVISTVCREGHLLYSDTINNMESGVVLEHVYPLLAAILTVLNREISDSTEKLDGNGVRNCIKYSDFPLHVSDTIPNNPVGSAERNRALYGVVDSSSIAWQAVCVAVWQWALRDPLSYLLQLPQAYQMLIRGKDVDETVEDNELASTDVSLGSRMWCRLLSGKRDAADIAKRQLVAAVNVLSLLNDRVAEGIGEQSLAAVLNVVLWLCDHPDCEITVWGVRVVGSICSLPVVQRSPQGANVISAAVVAGINILVESNYESQEQKPVFRCVSSTDRCLLPKVEQGLLGLRAANINCSTSVSRAAVNKHRLVAVSALSKVAAVLKDFHPRVPGESVLSLRTTELLLQAGVASCQDRSEIRPHGVRCLGNTLCWLREIASIECHQLECSTTRYPESVHWYSLCPELRTKCLDTLVECCSHGSNMKMRWNACFALGHLLRSPLPYGGSQQWRSSILTLLCSLLSNFPNFKVRIQACVALCGMPTRELYGSHYYQVWSALLEAATCSRNATDFLEMRHVDDLICQVVQGCWQLAALSTPSDCAWLRQLLHEHRLCLEQLLRRAHSLLPPHSCSAEELALHHVAALLHDSDVLTEPEMDGLLLIQRVLKRDL